MTPSELSHPTLNAARATQPAVRAAVFAPAAHAPRTPAPAKPGLCAAKPRDKRVATVDIGVELGATPPPTRGGGRVSRQARACAVTDIVRPRGGTHAGALQMSIKRVARKRPQVQTPAPRNCAKNRAPHNLSLRCVALLSVRTLSLRFGAARVPPTFRPCAAHASRIAHTTPTRRPCAAQVGGAWAAIGRHVGGKWATCGRHVVGR